MSSSKFEEIISWTSTALTIFGALVSSLGLYPYYVFIFIISNFGWIYCAIKWEKKPMLVTNLVLLVVEIGGLLWIYK